MQTTRQRLDTGWQVREIAPSHVPAHNHLPWLPAQVPGHVHLDLIRAGVIPDPFQRLYERDAAWVAESDWQYETTFTVEEITGSAFLVFHGLDTVAEIELNGVQIGQTDNMFIPHEFCVDGHVQIGANHLRVTFRSALRVGKDRWDAWHTEPSNDFAPPHWDNWAVRSFVRKAQYMYGWDWGPVLPSCGLWRPVDLLMVPAARLTEWKHTVEFSEDDIHAFVNITATVERVPGQEDTPLTLTASIDEMRQAYQGEQDPNLPIGPGLFTTDVDVEDASASVPTGPGAHTVSLRLTIDDPIRWQPNGATEDPSVGPALYGLELTLTTGDAAEFCDSLEANIGLRTVELVREPDADGAGEGFLFRVNGVDTYIKGANWIPNHSFPSVLENEDHAVDFPVDESVAQRVRDCVNTGFNMLRIWGGGLYESEHFYELCDLHGILVWQDFPFACAYYPDTGVYAEAIRQEATAAVRRIRNHPSLALWCGNNENHWFYEHDGSDPSRTRFIGEHLYHDILPAVVEAENPETAYWACSPYGGPKGDANCQTHGDCHNWDVWHGRGDWVYYTENKARFCSEFGFAASCSLGAWETVLTDSDKSPHSAAVKWHDKTRKGYDTYLNYVSLHFPEIQTLEDMVYLTQLNQAEALKYGIEHYRRLKGHNWGTLVWQINDCWPVHSWAMIDFTGQPKASWYWSRETFYAPLLLSLVRDGETVTAHLVNDLLNEIDGEITFTLATFDGEILKQETLEATAWANAANVAGTFDAALATGKERDVYLHALFTPFDEDIDTVQNFVFFAEPKDWRLSDPGLKTVIDETGDGHFTVRLTARRFAPYVWLRRADNAPLFPSTDSGDNFFHLQPGETRELTVPRSEITPTLEDLRGQLTVRTL